MTFLDWLTIMSFIALNVDIVLQIHRIYRTKSAVDLSIFGMTIRFLAIAIILAKYLSVHDSALIVGQIVIALTFTTYFGLALIYTFSHQPKRKKRR